MTARHPTRLVGPGTDSHDGGNVIWLDSYPAERLRLNRASYQRLRRVQSKRRRFARVLLQALSTWCGIVWTATGIGLDRSSVGTQFARHVAPDRLSHDRSGKV